MPLTHKQSKHRAHPKPLDCTHSSSLWNQVQRQCCPSTYPPLTWLWLTWIQDSFKANCGRRVGRTITKRQMNTKKTRFTMLALIPKNEIQLTINHIPCYSNNIHRNNHKSQQNKHKIKHKQGRVSASMFGQSNCIESRYQPLNPSPTIAQVLTTWIVVAAWQLPHYTWSGKVQSPHQETKTWQVGSGE